MRTIDPMPRSALLRPRRARATRAAQASPALRGRVDQVVALLRGEGDPAELFTPAFLAQVPAAQIRAVAQQLAAQYGAVRGLDRLDAAVAAGRGDARRASSGRSSTSRSRSSRSRRTGSAACWSPAPTCAATASPRHRRDPRAARPGQRRRRAARRRRAGDAGLARARPAAGDRLGVQTVHPRRAEPAGRRPASATGATSSRSTAARSRRARSQAWPPGAPVTLHTLAALMISVSDNTRRRHAAPHRSAARMSSG